MFTFTILKLQNGVLENVFYYTMNMYDFLFSFWQMLCLLVSRQMLFSWEVLMLYIFWEML